MAGWSQTIIIGNVGRDPQLRYTQSGVPMCDFSVAVTRRIGRRDDPNRTEKTTWFRVTCWRQLADIASQYVRKGTQIMVVGTIEASAYTDRSGQPAASLDLTADNFQLLGSRADAEARAGDYNDSAPPPSDNMSDIPF
ncbi:MAG: single-stranded DNA-binding protein [Aggregatilineales bacterium]